MAETPGSQTSEFKLTAGGIVGSFAVGIATALAGYPKIALLAAAIGAVLAAAYSIMRTWLKKERAGAVDWLSAQQEATLEKALRAVGTLSEVLKLVVSDDVAPGEKPEPTAPAEDANRDAG